jgi:hypothetical protein
MTPDLKVEHLQKSEKEEPQPEVRTPGERITEEPAPQAAEGELTDASLFDPEKLQEMQREAEVQAEATLNLVDQLAKSDLNADTEKLWLKVLDGLEPGPFSEYVINHLGKASVVEGPVRDKLIAIHATWEAKHGDKIFYTRDIARLEGALEGRKR